MRDFVDQVYVPDTLAIAGFYKDWFRQGEGLGNFMSYGDFPAKGMSDVGSFMLPRGVILNRDLSHIEEIDLNAEGRNPGVRQPFLVRLFRRQGFRPASVQGRNQAQLHGARSRPTRNWMWTRPTPGSSRRAGRASRWKSGRWPAS